VPPTIAREDILPKLRQNPYHLIEQGLRVFSGWDGDAEELDPRAVDWSRLGDGRRFPYRLRQDPGPQNPLGRIKFMFPNKYDVYLHDTPSRGLFNRTVRAGSSGCIRVADPIALAEYLLRDHPQVGPRGIRGAIESGRTLDFRLAEPVPIHLTYSTAWVDEHGTIQFRDDIYGRDARLSEALFPPLHVAGKN
jgi:L,D-transpeptidase YcbB